MIFMALLPALLALVGFYASKWPRDVLGGVPGAYLLGSRRCPWGFFFLTAPLAITCYHTNKTLLAAAPFGPFGDDNGPGLEPPPQNCIDIATAFMPSPPVVSGGPPESRAFPTSKLTIYLDDASSFEPSQRSSVFRHRLFRDARTYLRSEGIYTNLLNPRN
ncbi:hypothetical protein THAOC_14026 [Thalassiosira oceanica]|uniref:Uncharacterized protein n=1 Tax=Thalassiosira oceanica TaxID=159749 RepID=K0SJN4_THAOC|nr:hypothetical protein THAOC_14026 [Thalassiosira oceanica]|eukprot:EJK65154.1 hypothetical protein THAOC_14026 [Thalassiosira oceanica]